MTMTPCAFCGDMFDRPNRKAARRTCSRQCWLSLRARTRSVATEQTDVCGVCEESFTWTRTPSKVPRKYCSNHCRMVALQLVPRAKGSGPDGSLDGEGHVIFVVWENGVRRVRKRSALTVEAALGRVLAPGTIVHHINCIPDDDRPENLWVCDSQREHMRLHAYMERLEQLGLLQWPDGHERKPMFGKG